MRQKLSIDPGRFRSFIRLEAKDTLPDGYGGYSDEYESVADVWANISAVTNLISDYADNLRSVTTHQITIRWRDDCTAEMRFIYGTRKFTINAVRDPQENERYLVCDCEELL